MPLKVRHTHFLTRTVVYTTEYVDAVVVVLGIVQEAREGHRCQIDELQSFKVHDHSMLSSSTVIVTTKDDYLIARYQDSSFRFDREWELDEEDRPAVVRYIILLNRVNPPIALVPTEDIDVAVVAIFKDDCRHCASFLVEFGDAFPAVQVN